MGPKTSHEHLATTQKMSSGATCVDFSFVVTVVLLPIPTSRIGRVWVTYRRQMGGGVSVISTPLALVTPPLSPEHSLGLGQEPGI